MLLKFLMYALASFSVTIIPGPTMLLALSNGSTGKKQIVFWGILGSILSDALLISLVGLGVGFIIQTSPILFNTVKYIGFFYLLWISYLLWFSQTHGLTTDTSNIPTKKPFFYFSQSFMIAVSNPKGILFFTAFLPQFLTPHISAFFQFSLFILITIILNVLVMCLYAFVGYHSYQNFSAKALLIINRCCAFILSAMAIGLLFYKI